MWLKWLLSVSVCVVLNSSSGWSQKRLCDDPAATDSAIHYIWQHHAYTTPQYQDACDSLLALCPELDQVWQMKAMPYIKLGNWEKCFAALEKAVVLNPRQWLPYQAFLKCIFTKDYEGAIPELKAADKLMPGSGTMDHSFDFFIGLSYLCLDSLEQAETYLGKDIGWQEKSRGKGNVHHVSLLYMGLCQLKMKHYLVAEKIFHQCLNIYPQYPEANYYMGELYALTGKKILAKAYFVKARQCYGQGYNSSEDQEYYINYPFAIGTTEANEAIKNLN